MAPHMEPPNTNRKDRVGSAPGVSRWMPERAPWSRSLACSWIGHPFQQPAPCACLHIASQLARCATWALEVSRRLHRLGGEMRFISEVFRT